MSRVLYEHTKMCRNQYTMNNRIIATHVDLKREFGVCKQIRLDMMFVSLERITKYSSHSPIIIIIMSSATRHSEREERRRK